VPAWFKFINRDMLFLYLCKYGKKQVKQWRLKSVDSMNNLESQPEVTGTL
jgi:hypothetical protein